MTHVPYKGGAGQMIPAMIAGEVPLAFFNLASTLPHIRSGRLKALATIRAAAPARAAGRPDHGRAGLRPGRHQCLAGDVRARGATPKPVVDKLYATVAQVLSKPE